VETVCDILSLAHMHTAERLKARATAFFKANATEAIMTEGWNDLLRENPTLVGPLVAAALATNSRHGH
jgi:hypothetical protein